MGLCSFLQKKLDAAILYRSNVRNRLELDVGTLDQLNSSLFLLEEVRDMENKIDGIYLPIETLYNKLRYVLMMDVKFSNMIFRPRQIRISAYRMLW